MVYMDPLQFINTVGGAIHRSDNVHKTTFFYAKDLINFAMNLNS